MSDRRPVITDDGNARLTVLESDGKKDLQDYPKLNISHLQMPAIVKPDDTSRTVAREVDAILDRSLRAKAVGAGLFRMFKTHRNILLELYLLGEQGWIAKIKETMRPDSLAHGLTDAELGLAWETFELNIMEIAKMDTSRGAFWRKRKDSRG